MRLNKYLAEKTGISRRQADELIKQGKVIRIAHGEKHVAAIGERVEPTDVILINGEEIDDQQRHTTILLNKPVGYLSSRASQGGDPTVYDLLPKKYKSLKTAGRLDKDSSGLMILSSDGDLIQRLTHPRYSKVKIYKIKLDKPLQPLHQQMISDFGIDLPDGKSQMTLEEIRDKRQEVSESNGRKHWQVTMTEGRNRQIRRTFAALGYTVKKLHRTELGQYSLNDLKSGDFHEIQ